MFVARIWVSEGAAGLLRQQQFGGRVWSLAFQDFEKNKDFRRVSFMPWDVGVKTHDHSVQSLEDPLYRIANKAIQRFTLPPYRTRYV